MSAEDVDVNPIMAVTKPSEEAVVNPIMGARDSDINGVNPLAAANPKQGQAVQLHDSPPMMYNPLVTRGDPTVTPPATPHSLTSPLSPEPILADAAVIVPVISHLAAQNPVGEPGIPRQPPAVIEMFPSVGSAPEIQAAMDDSSHDLSLAPIQTPRNAEVNPRDRTRIKPLSGGNNGPVPTAMARAQSGGSPAFLGFGRVSPSPKKSLTDLARKVPSRTGSEASGSRRNSPAASPYASPAVSRQSSPTRRPSRRSSPAGSRAGSPTKGRFSRPSSPVRVSRAPSDMAHRPPKQPVRPIVPAAAAAVAAAQLVHAQSMPPSESWIDPHFPAQISDVTGQQAGAKSQQAQAADSAAVEKPYGAAVLVNLPPAKARAAALRQEQESQVSQQLWQQPLSVSSHISRSAKERAAAAGLAAHAASADQASSSSTAPGPGLAVKAPPPSNPKARVMEDLRAAELARAIAPEPRVAAAPPPNAPPSKLAFGGRNAVTGVVEQPRALTAKHFKALARQLEDNKPVEDALAMEASLSLAHLEQNTSMSRRSKGAAPETIAEAEPLQDPRAATDGGGGPQQDPMQSPFAAAAHGRATPRMSAEDMTAMAMEAIDRIRGRAQQPDELPVELGPPRPERGARSLSLPKSGSSEDLSAIALAAIARLRNMADKAKESPRSSSAPRPERVSHFESEQERSARLRLPSGPSQATAGPARTTSAQLGKSTRAQRSSQKSFSKASPSEAVRPPVQSGGGTPAMPATPDRLSPDVPVASTPPSRSWSPDSPESTVVSAAEVAAAAHAAQPSGPSLAEVINTPRTDRLGPQRAQHAEQPSSATASQAGEVPSQLAGSPETTSTPVIKQQPTEPSEASDSGSDTSGSITAPPRQLVASRVVNLPSQPAASPRSAAEAVVPSSPSASSTGSSVAEREEEPYVFDEAAAAAKAKEKGKAILAQPEIRPVCSA